MSRKPTGQQPFPATRWTVVARAAGQETTEAARRGALEDLCTAYWFPLYAFARGRGAAPADAEDFVQGFFASVLPGEFLSRADPERGRLRTYLLTAFTRHMAAEHRRETRQKRGGGTAVISIDMQDAETRLRSEATAAGHGIEDLFNRRWAHAVVTGTMRELEHRCSGRGQQDQFAVLKPFLDGAEDESSYQRAAAALDLAVNVVRQRVYRLRIEFRQIMRERIADTLDSPTEAGIAAELQELKRVLRS